MRKFLTHVFRPGTGRTVPAATVHVKSNPSTSGSPDAAIYSDAAGTLQITQPMSANANGMIEFYAPDGHYDMYFSIPDPVYGTISYSWTDISIDSTDTTNSIVGGVQGAHFVTTENDASLPNRVWIPTFKGHPDTPPSSPPAFNNEFDTAIGTNGWAGYNNDANSNTVLETINGRLHIGQNSVEKTNPNMGYQHAFSDPGGDFTLTTRISLGYYPGTVAGVMGTKKPFFGLGIKSNLGEVQTISLGPSAMPTDGTHGISVYRTNYNSGGLVSSNAVQAIGSNACYVRIRRKTAVYYFEWSADGLSYVTIDQISTSLFSGSYAYAGLYLYATFDTGGFADCYADFIRQS